jgi:hypothetical protein
VGLAADGPQICHNTRAAGRLYCDGMHLIDDGDEQLFSTVIVAARLGKSDRIIDALEAEYDERWDQPETIFRYALAQVAMVRAHNTELQRRASYAKSLAALDEVLAFESEHWLARYCRARHRILIRTGYGQYPTYLSEERDKAAEDIELLLQGQEHQPWQPYFASLLMLAAQFHAELGEPGRATEMIADAAARPRLPIRFAALGVILGEPFTTLSHGQLPQQAKATVAMLMTAAFPGTTIARSTVRAGTGARD